MRGKVVGLIADIIPDWNWAKRSGTETDGSPLTVRRALLLKSLLNARLPAFFLVNFVSTEVLKLMSQIDKVFAGLVFGLVFLSFFLFLFAIFADWDRQIGLARIESHFTRVTGAVKDNSAVITIIATIFVFVCALAFVPSLRETPIIGDPLTQVRDFARELPVFGCFMLVLLAAECERVRGLLASAHPIMDQQIATLVFDSTGGEAII